MSATSGSAPAWLFSFLDLAFLILIAVLLTADQAQDEAPALASIDLPEIQRSSTGALEIEPGTQWQLRVHPRPAADEAGPFSLALLGQQGSDPIPRYDASALEGVLRELAADEAHKPLLAPHRDSRSEDFLTALGFVQEVWPEAHFAAVRPRTAMPAVSAAPGAVEIP
ncbi:MAG: hypothetical protein GY944_24400 [bacterium]|nr:hypothetical protein [bacterium]MCP5044182.1 hypothetical protein [bacterium]